MPEFVKAVICSSIIRGEGGLPKPIRERTRIILADEPRRENHRLQAVAIWRGDVQAHEIKALWFWPDKRSHPVNKLADYVREFPEITAFSFPVPSDLPSGTHTFEFFCDENLAGSISLEVASGEATP